MDTDVAAPRPGSRRTILVAAVVALVVGLVLGGLATAGMLHRVPRGAGPGGEPSASAPPACTAIGASDGMRVEFTREQAADATALTLQVHDDHQSTVVEQDIDEGMWNGDIGYVTVSTTRETMDALRGVELTFHGPSGDRTLAAADLGTPTEFSPNGENCEPHVLQSAFRVEGDELVRIDA